MIDIPSNLTDGASVYLGDKRFVYNVGKLVPYVVTNVGTELPSALLNTEILTTERHPISNKPIYKKGINFGSLPNATTKTVAHGISGIDFIMIDFSNSFMLVPGVPDASFSGMIVWSGADSVGAYLSSGNIFVYAGNNRTNMVGYFTLKYTKTADTSSSPVKSLYTGSLNELRQNVETHAGYKRNGKEVYQIEVDFGFLPNATTKSVLVPILEPTYTCWIDGSNSYVYAGDTYNQYYPLNIPNPTNTTLQITGYVSPKTKSVNVITGINRSDQPAKIVVNYTK